MLLQNFMYLYQKDCRLFCTTFSNTCSAISKQSFLRANITCWNDINPLFETTNLDFLPAASMWDSRGLTAAELFGSWTRWPRLPDASLTQGQNPEWKPLMFLTGCQLGFSLSLSLFVALSLSPCRSPPSLSFLVPSLLCLIYSLLLPSLFLLWSSPTSKSGLT